MIDYIHENIVFVCDGCSEGLEPDPPTKDMNAAVAARKSANWRARFVGGDWKHYCPDCSG